MLSMTEFEARWQRTQDMMGQWDLDAILVSDKYNYWYLTGHLTREIEKKRPMLFLLPREGRPTFIIYKLGEKAARQTAGSAQFLTYEDLPLPVEQVTQAITDSGLEASRVGMELGLHERLGISDAEFDVLKSQLPSMQTADAGPLMQELRLIKSAGEIEVIREVCAMSLRAWDNAMTLLAPGMNNDDIKRVVAAELCKEGSDFDVAGHVTVGAGGGVGDAGYGPGDVLWSDFGGTLDGYQADIARRVSFGQPTEEYAKIQVTIAAVMERQLGALRPGARCSDVARACSDALREQGFPGLHPKKRVGHGLGLSASETPSLSESDDTVLRPGMVLTPEPRFYLSSGEMVHIEEVVAITEDGYLRLTEGAEELGRIG